MDATQNSDDLVDMGEKHQQAGQLHDAESCYRKALEIDPGHPGALYFLAGLACEDGRLQLAKELIAELLESEPNDAEAWHLSGVVAVKEANPRRATECFRQVVVLQPANAQAHYSFGLILSAQGDLDAALESFQRAIGINPALTEAHTAIENILRAQGKIVAVAPSQHHASKTNLPIESRENIARMLVKQGRLDEAIATYRKAIAEAPASANLHLDLARALMDKSLDADAITCLQRVISLDPNCAEAYGRLGHLLNQQCRISEGIAALQQAVALMPASSRLSFYLSSALHKAGKLPEAIACLQQAMALNPNNIDVYTALLGTRLYSPDYSPEQALADRSAFSERFEGPLRQNWPIHSKAAKSHKRLRVGFVSGDFLSHPVGYFLEAVLRELRKRDGIDIILYSMSTTEDAVTHRIRATAHTWSSVSALSDDAFEQRIRADNLNILVDLSGHTNLHRLLVFARKPAAVQVTWLGDCGTTGLKAIDYILCDRHSVHNGEAKFYSEKPWYLPHTRLCLTAPTEWIAVAPLPAIVNGYVTFGCFNNLIKMSERVVAVWARILKHVPNARLMLKSASFFDAGVREDVLQRFAVHGVAADRLLLKPGSPRQEYFAAYNSIDIALDPFPFTGGTTSVDGIWMGVPMVTKRGDSIASRQGESILLNLDLQEWIANDDDDYVELAVRQAANLTNLAALRGRLRAKLEASPLCDAKLFAQHLDEAFKRMWQTYCDAASSTQR